MTRAATEPSPSAAATTATGDRTPALSVRGVTVAYHERPVLRAVSFDVPRGSILGVIGPNGAGKSTLLKSVLGLARVDAGEVELFGRPIAQQRAKVAYVPQTESVDWDFPVTAAEVVLMGRYPALGWFGRPGAADRAAAAAALEMVGMSDLAHRHIRKLSGGQQKRVFVARALAQGADVLLLDEPFAGVDAATERAIFDLIRALTTDGKTLLVVNHDLSILDRFDLVLMLNHRAVAFGPPHVVVNEENLRRTYGGRLSLLDRADAALTKERVTHDPELARRA